MLKNIIKCPKKMKQMIQKSLKPSQIFVKKLNTIEKLEGQSTSDLKKETLSKICKDIKYEIENLESQSPSNLKKETLSEITINIKNKIEKLEGQHLVI